MNFMTFYKIIRLIKNKLVLVIFNEYSIAGDLEHTSYEFYINCCPFKQGIMLQIFSRSLVIAPYSLLEEMWPKDLLDDDLI